VTEALLDGRKPASRAELTTALGSRNLGWIVLALQQGGPFHPVLFTELKPGFGGSEVVLVDRTRLQKSEGSSPEASLEQVSRKQT
jgi:hypothetical protein